MAKAADYKIIKKKNGRYQIRTRGGGTINGEEKIKILVEKKLIKTTLPKKEEPAEEAPAEEAAEAPAEGAE